MSSVSPQEIGSRIRQLRTERALSQDDLAKALGMHRQTISLLEQGKRELTARELDTFASFLQISYDDVLAPKQQKPRERTARPGLRFRPEKLRQLLLTLLQRVGGFANVGETVLYKLLYFCDFNHYEKTGYSISGMTYKRMQFGPVPQLSHFGPVMEEMIEKKQIEKMRHAYYGMPQTRYIPLCDPAPHALNEEERLTISDVVKKLGSMNATHIEEYVHSDVPWEATEPNKAIDYELVHWRTEPHAMRTDEDALSMMMSAAAADSEKHLEPLSEKELSYYENLPEITRVRLNVR